MSLTCQQQQQRAGEGGVEEGGEETGGVGVGGGVTVVSFTSLSRSRSTYFKYPAAYSTLPHTVSLGYCILYLVSYGYVRTACAVSS